MNSAVCTFQRVRLPEKPMEDTGRELCGGEETLILNSARENGNLQHGAVSVDEKLVSMGERNLVSLTLTGFLL